MARRPAALLVGLLLAACAPEPPAPAPATTPPPAATRPAPTGFIRTWPGELPIVLSVPHDGALLPSDIPDRMNGVTVRDTHARALAEAIRDALQARCGRAPHLVVCELSRRKVDCNRALAEGAEDPKAARTWREYHDAIDAAEQAVLARSPHGLYLDIHSHGHPKKRLEIGYLLKPADLRLPDARLDADETVAARSSIRALSRRTPARFSELLRGETSLGGLLGARGVAAVPSPTEVVAPDEPYFNGAYDIAAHGSRDGGRLDAVQLEVPGPQRDTPEHRAATARAIAESLEVYFERHFRAKLR
jgi:hypothetical protein